jgi:hypothetical protein
MEDLLKKLINLNTTKFSRTITVSSDKSDFRINFPVPITLDRELNYELGLMWFSTYNSIYNITKENNIFRYSKDSGKTFKDVNLIPGAYEVKDINLRLQPILGDKNFNIAVDSNINRVIIKLPENFQVDFTKENTFHELIGFEKKVYKDKVNIGENIGKISKVLSINIECDLVNGNYTNGELNNILYSFPANAVPLGYNMIERMNPPKYLPVSRKMIDSIHIRIIDQDGDLISFNGEEITMWLDLKQV